jgi:putative ABC transport system substrate-binding protein
MRRREFIAGLGAAAWPLAAGAQQPGRTYRIGGLSIQPRSARHWVALFEELRRVGFVEGRNFAIAGRGWEYPTEQFPEMAADLVKANVDVIVCIGDAAIRAAQQATAKIPILGVTDDMVGSGLTPSLAKQGGNTTGVSIFASELDVKRLQILHEFAPKAQRIAVLADPTTVSTRAQLATAARDLGMEIVWFEAQSPDQIGRALDSMAAAKVEAANVLGSPLLTASRVQIIDNLRNARIPAIYQFPETAEDGGLLGYGPSIVLMFREIVARQLVRLLQGAAVSDLPIEQPTKFELVVNRRTADAIGLALSPSLLLRADRVIE